MNHIQTCNMCNSEFSLDEHDTGLVLNGEHFACTSCISHSDSSQIMEWARSNSEHAPILRPIHVWLVENEAKLKYQ